MSHIKKYREFLAESKYASEDDELVQDFLKGLKQEIHKIQDGEKAIEDFIETVDVTDFGASGPETEKEYNDFLKQERNLYKKVLTMSKKPRLMGIHVEDESFMSCIMDLEDAVSIVRKEKQYMRPIGSWIKEVALGDVTVFVMDDGSSNYFVFISKDQLTPFNSIISAKKYGLS